MPVVAELYGFPFGSARSRAAIADAKCRFTGEICDGGGNRDMATVDLHTDSGVRARFSPSVVAAGKAACAICSVGMKAGSQIICPRRLLSFGEHGFSEDQKKAVELICRTAGFASGATVQFWSELSLNFSSDKKRFQYRLDYLLREVQPDGSLGPPIIVEIMTCSTSGGNKRLGTDIQTAFRRALLSAPDDVVACPGINIRQVWARMASQLIVKSEAALAWGGKTIWVVQDSLAHYMGNNTGLALQAMKSRQAGEVNIIACSADHDRTPVLYSGPITGGDNLERSFSDILRAPFLPTRTEFLAKIDVPSDGQFIAP